MKLIALDHDTITCFTPRYLVVAPGRANLGSDATTIGFSFSCETERMAQKSSFVEKPKQGEWPDAVTSPTKQDDRIDVVDESFSKFPR